MLDRADVDTDQIIPKQFLKRVERTGFGEFLFYDWAKEPGWDLPRNPILAAGRNFGCGSSREHAPWALEDYGFRAIVAPSFADIFFSNCTKIGLLPVVLPEEDVRARWPRRARPRSTSRRRRSAGRAVARFEIDPEIKHRLLNGLDDIALTLEQGDAIAAYERERERDRAGHDRAVSTRDWDAATYDRVSAPQQAWAAEQLDRLELRGDETVLDAGCGSGKITAELVRRLPAGRVYAVDAAPSMVRHTRARGARPPRPATVLAPTSTELVRPEPVNVIFSNATFHWIPDHDALFAALYRNLRPGGRLVAQCGGKGNIDRFRRLSDEVATEEPFAPYFANWRKPWNYATAEETAERLQRAGFTDVSTWLQDRPTELAEPRAFVATVCLVRHLDPLPEELREPFVDRVMERAGEPVVLDYVRLNMTARRRAAWPDQGGGRRDRLPCAAMAARVTPGDGIGPEIMAPALDVLAAVGAEFEYEEHVFGGASIDAHGTALTDETLAACRAADAVLLAAVGGPKWDTTDPDAPAPEQGLLGLRKGLGLYANLRPVRPLPALYDASPLRRERIEGTDLLVVRELTGGIYFGARRATADSAYDTCEYTVSEIERIARIAFEAARTRG